MPDENRQQNETQGQSGGGSSSSGAGDGQTGDPGRTPDTAEGDEQTVDQDIEQKLGGQS